MALAEVGLFWPLLFCAVRRPFCHYKLTQYYSYSSSAPGLSMSNLFSRLKWL